VPACDPLLRDLYLLAEAAAVDCLLVRMLPRLRSSLWEARLEADEWRPFIPRASRQDRAMEALVQALLTADPATPPAPFIVAETPGASRRWAEEQRVPLMELAGPYRGMEPVPLWGVTAAAPEPTATASPGDAEGPPPSGRGRTLPRRPRVRDAGEEEDDAEPGTWMVRADDLQEKAEDPAGLQRPADRDQHADPGELADALSELPELGLVRSTEAVREVLVGEDPIRRCPGLGSAPQATGIA
jgi:nitric oxide reductase NorD protein